MFCSCYGGIGVVCRSVFVQVVLFVLFVWVFLIVVEEQSAVKVFGKIEIVLVFELFVVNLLLFAPFSENVPIVVALVVVVEKWPMVVILEVVLVLVFVLVVALVVVAEQSIGVVFEIVLVYVLIAEEILVFELFAVNLLFSEDLLIAVLVLFA